MEENYMLILGEKNQIEAVKRTNDYTEKFGLRLSDQDIQELVIRRRECLSEQKRVEFGNGILEKLIFEFCDSD